MAIHTAHAYLFLSIDCELLAYHAYLVSPTQAL